MGELRCLIRSIRKCVEFRLASQYHFAEWRAWSEWTFEPGRCEWVRWIGEIYVSVKGSRTVHITIKVFLFSFVLYLSSVLVFADTFSFFSFYRLWSLLSFLKRNLGSSLSRFFFRPSRLSESFSFLFFSPLFLLHILTSIYDD